MHTITLGRNTYKLDVYKGYKHIATIIRPLGSTRKVNWDAEHLTLHKQIKSITERLGVPYDYDPYFTLPKPTGKAGVVYLVTHYHPYIDSLPDEAHVESEKPHMADKWGYRAFLQKTKDIPMSTWPSRLALIGSIPLSQIAEARYVYTRLQKSDLLDIHCPLSVYQCTCGRVLIVPAQEGKPVRDFGSCGCLAGVYGVLGSRDIVKRRLDAFREWSTMVMACYDTRSVYYDPANRFDLPSYVAFAEWYEEQVLSKPLTKRFVARKDPTEPFSIKNLKIVDKCLDTIPKYGYTIL